MCSRHTESESSCIHIFRLDMCLRVPVSSLYVFYLWMVLCGNYSISFTWGQRIPHWPGREFHRGSAQNGSHWKEPTPSWRYHAWYSTSVGLGGAGGSQLCALEERNRGHNAASLIPQSNLPAGCFTVLMQKTVFDCTLKRVRNKTFGAYSLPTHPCLQIICYVCRSVFFGDFPLPVPKRTCNPTPASPMPLLKYLFLPPTASQGRPVMVKERAAP